MFARLICSFALAVLLLAPAWQARADDQQRVHDDLVARGADDRFFTIAPITENFVSNTFPETSFFEVFWRQFPVQFVEPPPGLARTNVAYVQAGNVAYLTDSATDLEAFYFDQLGPVAGADEAKDAGRTWLRLSAGISQDGFYAFGRSIVEFVKGVVTGHLDIVSGGSGHIDVTLTFDNDGVLTSVEEDKKVLVGARPICQATKLLDADPIVRRMAEQAILVMGKACKEYLDEQKAKAKPELKKEIERVWKRICDEGR
jgi:hypothetical protein